MWLSVAATATTTRWPSVGDVKLRSVPLLVFVVAATGILTFADRAPHVAKAVLDGGRHINQGLERQVGADWLSRGDLPFEGDTIGHFLLWATLLFVAGAALPRVPILLLLAPLSVVAVVSESLQTVLTNSREPSPTDLLANFAGLAMGAIILVISREIRPAVRLAVSATPSGDNFFGRARR